MEKSAHFSLYTDSKDNLIHFPAYLMALTETFLRSDRLKAFKYVGGRLVGLDETSHSILVQQFLYGGIQIGISTSRRRRVVKQDLFGKLESSETRLVASGCTF